MAWIAVRAVDEVNFTEHDWLARRLCQGFGFAVTGERKPLPSHPQYAEIAMARLT
jgi:hypothetical protein